MAVTGFRAPQVEGSAPGGEVGDPVLDVQGCHDELADVSADRRIVRLHPGQQVLHPVRPGIAGCSASVQQFLAGTRHYVRKPPISWRSSSESKDSSSAARRVSAAPRRASPDVRATSAVASAIPDERCAASETLRRMSLEFAVCSSTAAAMVAWMSLISPTMVPIW